MKVAQRPGLVRGCRMRYYCFAVLYFLFLFGWGVELWASQEMPERKIHTELEDRRFF